MKMKGVVFLIVLLGVFTSYKPIFSQENLFQVWLDYNPEHKLNSNFQLLNDYGFRWQNDADASNWFRLHARFGLSYKKSTLWDYRAGIGFFYTQNVDKNNIFEIRPWQGVKLAWPNIKRFRFKQYARIEERISFDLNSSSGDNFVLKLRYMFSINLPINNSVISVGTFYVPIGIELFFDLTLNNQEFLNDRIRFDTGLGYRWKEDIYFRILYTFQQSYNNTDNGVDSNTGYKQFDHILRISVIQKFGYTE